MPENRDKFAASFAMPCEERKIEVVAHIFIMFAGAGFTAIGVLMGDIANTLNISVAEAVANCSVFTFSRAVMAFLVTGVILEIWSIKKTSIITCAILFLGLILVLTATNILMFDVALLIFGMGYGMCFSLGYYYIILITEKRIRASKMALVSLSYAVGATIAPKAVTLMLHCGLSWRMSLFAFVVFIILALLLILNTNFKINGANHKTEEQSELSWRQEICSWPVSVYFVSLALIFYVIAETIIILWLPILGEREMGLSIDTISTLVSVFWGSVIVGRFFATIILKIFSQEAYISSICAVSGALMAVISLVHMSYYITFVVISITGFCVAGAYSTIASMGTTQTTKATNRLTTAVLGSGTIGTIIAPALSGYIESIAGIQTVFIIGALFMLSITIITVGIRVFKLDARKI